MNEVAHVVFASCVMNAVLSFEFVITEEEAHFHLVFCVDSVAIFVSARFVEEVTTNVRCFCFQFSDIFLIFQVFPRDFGVNILWRDRITWRHDG